jgi:hypothetical protein
MKIRVKLISVAIIIVVLLGCLISNAYANYPGDFFELYRFAQNYEGEQSPAAGQCKGFVQYVYKQALNIDVPLTDEYDLSRWQDNGQFMEVGHATLDSSSLAINFSRLKNLIILASPGDVIQMDMYKDSDNPSCHSMIYIGVDGGSILVIHSNWKPDNYVSVNYFSLEDLVNYIGFGGGITIYRPY